MEALRKEIVQIHEPEQIKNVPYKRPDYWSVYFNGKRIGHVTYKQDKRWINDPETPEQKEERLKKNRYSYSSEPGHYEPFNYYEAYIVNSNTQESSRDDRHLSHEHSTLFSAKKAVIDAYRRKEASSEYGYQKQSNISYLPCGDNSNFYPTPSALAGKMFDMVQWDKVRAILEPSAGKGDLIDALLSFREHNRYKKHSHVEQNFDIDCIEIDQNLRYILQGKCYRVVYDDFLSYTTRKQYDLVIMNPPFSDGDKHLLKAIEMQSDGGQIVCLLNAETLRNAYTNSRQTLIQKLRKYDANIRYIQGAFARSERPSQVEVALISLNIPHQRKMDSEFFSRMEQAHTINIDENGDPVEIAPANMIERMIREYNIEVDASLAFLREYNALIPHIQDSSNEYSHPLIALEIGGKKYDGSNYCRIDNEAINVYMKSVRSKYWYELLHKPEITGKLTSELQKEYYNSVERMADYDFSMFNIEQIIVGINAQIISGIESQIMKLFDELSAEHAYYDECKTNIHYYSGWKTNKAHKIGMKVILPIHGFNASYSWKKDELDEYSCAKTLCDLELTFDYLDGKRNINYVSPSCVIRNANRNSQTKNIEFKYWTATFYKKGTVHLKFKNEQIIETLNIYAGRTRAWLPPYYGKMRYEDMPDDGRTIIDEFQGKEAYEQVLTNPGVYLVGAKEFAALTAGNI
jgi:hypothetical protein